MFLGGHLPGKALLHLRILNLFGMITRLQGSFLHRVAVYQLSSAKVSSGTWFLQVRDLFIQYLLPSPLTLLQHPMSKYSYQKIIKSRLIDFWGKHLRGEGPLPKILQSRVYVSYQTTHPLVHMWVQPL